MSCIAEFRLHRAQDCGVQIGIIKHNEWCIAAQFKAEFRDILGCICHELTANFRRTGKADFAHTHIRAECVADLTRIARDAGQYAFGNARFFGKAAQCERGQRGGAGRFDNHRTTGGKRGASLARDHRCWKIPWCNRGCDTNRLFQNNNSHARIVRGDNIAVDALSLFGEPFDEVRGIYDFAPCLGQGFALLGGHDCGQIVDVGHHQVEPAAQDGRALFRCLRGPCGHRFRSRRDRLLNLGTSEMWDRSNNLVIGRISDLERSGSIDPFTA